MRQLPLYLRLQQLLDGELPEEQYRELSDLEREFQALDEVDNQKDEASDDELELDELEGELLTADSGEETDLSSLIDRRTELEAQLFGDEEPPWSDASEEIGPLRELIETLSDGAGGRPWGLGRPRLERLLKAVDDLDPNRSAREPTAPRRRRRNPSSRSLVASRRRQLLAEFRAAWKDALEHTPAGPSRPAPNAPEVEGSDGQATAPQAGGPESAAKDASKSPRPQTEG